MRRIFPLLLFLAVLGGVALLASGCGAGDQAAPAAAAPRATRCPAAWLPGWQKLADRIQAAVYCPSWMPDPLTGQIAGSVSYGGAGGYALSVSRDGSYLASFAWSERESGELHVNLRGYPGETSVPTCRRAEANRGRTRTTTIPCFSDSRGSVHEGAITATVYTVNQDADLWHVLYAWHYRGGLYTLSEHVALPLTYKKVVANLHRMLRGLVLVEPHAT